MCFLYVLGHFKQIFFMLGHTWDWLGALPPMITVSDGGISTIMGVTKTVSLCGNCYTWTLLLLSLIIKHITSRDTDTQLQICFLTHCQTLDKAKTLGLTLHNNWNNNNKNTNQTVSCLGLTLWRHQAYWSLIQTFPIGFFILSLKQMVYCKCNLNLTGPWRWIF